MNICRFCGGTHTTIDHFEYDRTHTATEGRIFYKQRKNEMTNETVTNDETQLTELMRTIMGLEAVWLIVGIFMTGVTTASMVLWVSVAWLAISAYSGTLVGSAGAEWVLAKIKEYLVKSKAKAEATTEEDKG